METNNSTVLEALTPEEYSKRVNGFYVTGDVNGLLEFQKTHNILYEDPIPEQDKKILKDIEITEIPDNIELI
jgi:hypothetical protein